MRDAHIWSEHLLASQLMIHVIMISQTQQQQLLRLWLHVRWHKTARVKNVVIHHNYKNALQENVIKFYLLSLIPIVLVMRMDAIWIHIHHVLQQNAPTPLKISQKMKSVRHIELGV